MTLQRMPAAEVPIDTTLVRALLREQHEDLASLPLVHAGEGWDNMLFRLGDDLLVRLPRRQMSASLIEHEQRWLPELAPQLPLRVPAPVRVGRPGCGFPWSWSVVPWFGGETAATLTTGHTEAIAVRLAAFLAALHRPAPMDAPANPFRTSLSSRSDVFIERVQHCGQLDQESALRVWHAALAAPAWRGPAVWLHADLHPGNLVVNAGELTAVIDFGDITAGDPAVDLAVAWMMWPAGVRAQFRAAIDRRIHGADEGLWRRARGWAVSLGVAYLVNSLDNPLMADIGERTVAAVLADDG